MSFISKGRVHFMKNAKLSVKIVIIISVVMAVSLTGMFFVSNSNSRSS